MWGLVFVFSMVTAMGAFMILQEARTPVAEQALDSRLAVNMAFYRSLVLDHLRGHPIASGTVPDDVLAFPDWYMRHPAWRNEVLPDGTVVVYAASSLPPSLVTQLVEVSRGSIFAGQARRHPDGQTTLFSPRHGDTGIVLPALSPGTVVWLARLD
jgi:hypothetical protein